METRTKLVLLGALMAFGGGAWSQPSGSWTKTPLQVQEYYRNLRSQQQLNETQERSRHWLEQQNSRDGSPSPPIGGGPAALPSAADQALAREQERLYAERVARERAEREPERRRIRAWVDARVDRIANGRADAGDYTSTLDLRNMNLQCRERPVILQTHEESLQIADKLLAMGFLDEASECRFHVDALRMLHRMGVLGLTQTRQLAYCGGIPWNVDEQRLAADKVGTAVYGAYTGQWIRCHGAGRTQAYLPSMDVIAAPWRP